MYYILEDKKPKQVELLEWAKWFQTKNRVVKQTAISKKVSVSTVFLGIDHGFGNPEPLLFETMIFGGRHDEYQERHATYEEALAGHQKALDLINSK